MDALSDILRRVPLFRHASDDEILRLAALGTLSVTRKGHTFDLKRVNTFNVVVRGIFEIEALGKTDIVYLSPGSCFGTVPFTENRHRGVIRAMVDSTLLMIAAEDLYRFFFTAYRCLRGYLRTAGHLGFELTAAGRSYAGAAGTVVAVHGPDAGAGRTLASALLGLGLRGRGRTIVLDCSFSGTSVFSLLGQRLTAPLAHRSDDHGAAERLVTERIERVDDRLDVMNVSFGAHVAADPDILEPLLFLLGRTYDFVIMDCAPGDNPLALRALELADRVIALVPRPKDVRRCFALYDGHLRDGQQVSYVVNEYGGTVRSVTGARILPRFEAPGDEGIAAWTAALAASEPLADLVDVVAARRRALVLESNLYDALFMAGFFIALGEAGKEFDIVYGSALSFAVAALWMTGGGGELVSLMERFFGDDRLPRLLDVAFPDAHVFRNNALARLAGEVAGGRRLEMFASLPVARCGEAGLAGSRLFSTGDLGQVLAASLVLYPIFEQIDIAGSRYHAGFPQTRTRVEDLFRTDAVQVTYLSVNNRPGLVPAAGRALPFYTDFTAYLLRGLHDDKESDLADRNLVIDVSARDAGVEHVVELSLEACRPLVKRL